MLTRLRLTRFKSFVDEEIEIAPLTLLVGANASGKSNLLDAIWLLHGTSFDLPPDDIFNGEKRSAGNRWEGIRGGSAEAARYGESSFALESTWHSSGESEPHRFRIEYTTKPTLSLNMSDIDQECLESLSQVRWLDLQPREMRGYGSRSPILGERGGNFSGFLAQLCDDPEERTSLVNWLAALCAPELTDLDFIEVPEVGDVLAVLVEKGGERITARSISDGTLRFLGTLMALRTADPGTLFLLEDIEAGLHPARIQLLVSFLEAAVREREIQIIATTHSPTVLEWLTEEALGDTVVCGRIPGHEGTIARRLQSIPHFQEVVARTGIAEMFSTGWLEMAL